jgi:hypothetical protein
VDIYLTGYLLNLPFALSNYAITNDCSSASLAVLTVSGTVCMQHTWWAKQKG